MQICLSRLHVGVVILIQTKNFDTKLNFGLQKNLAIFRMESVVLQNQSVLYQLNSWQIAAMSTRFVRGFPVIAHSDVLLRERSMLVTETRLLYWQWSRQSREQYYTQHGSTAQGRSTCSQHQWRHYTTVLSGRHFVLCDSV
jgi:hypothetical protein